MLSRVHGFRVDLEGATSGEVPALARRELRERKPHEPVPSAELLALSSGAAPAQDQPELADS